MTQTLLAWSITLAALMAAYPWSAWLLARSPYPLPSIMPVLVSLALATGTLSLLMFWEALLGIPFRLWGIILPYFALMLPGWVLWWRSQPLRFARVAGAQHAAPLPTIIMVSAIGIVGAAILF
ncbi:MAG: hypothetical protein K8I30_04555, partial [Anaerolineae bacterium]|nr:hypothetical protein [Anaerolineae bacterium]